MKAVSAFASLMLLAIVPAQAQSLGEKSGANALVGEAPSTPDFVKEAALSDMFEIRASDLATRKSNDPATQAFAKEMLADHEKTSNDLKTLIQEDKINAAVPTTLGSDYQSKLDTLTKDGAGDFTKDYHSQQVSAHKDGVSLFQRYAKGGDNQALKDWAGKTLPTLQHHLDMAQALDK